MAAAWEAGKIKKTGFFETNSLIISNQPKTQEFVFMKKKSSFWSTGIKHA